MKATTNNRYLNSILSVVIASIFLIFVCGLVALEREPNKPSENRSNQTLNEDKSSVIEQAFLYIDCVERKIDDCENIHEPTVSIQQNGDLEGGENRVLIASFFSWFTDAPFFIKSVYLSLLASFACMVFFVIDLKSSIIKDQQKYYHSADLFVTIMPVLGILGTFYSIAIALDGQGAIASSEKIVESFFNGLMTSIVGMIFYISSMFLRKKIYMELNIEAS